MEIGQHGEMAVPAACETRWNKMLVAFERHHDTLITGRPDAKQDTEIVHTALITIVQLVHTSPRINRNGAVWKQLADRAEAEKGALCRH
jgi:hypothetical protein